MEATGLLFTLPPLPTYLMRPTSCVPLQRGRYDTHIRGPQGLNPPSTPSHTTPLGSPTSTWGSAIPTGYNTPLSLSAREGWEERGGEGSHRISPSPPSLLCPSPTRVGRGNPPQSGSKVCGSGLHDCWLSPS